METSGNRLETGRARVVWVHVLSFILLTALAFRTNEPALFLRFDGLMHLTEAENQQRWGGPPYLFSMDFTKANGEFSFTNLYRLNPGMVVGRWAGHGTLIVWVASTILATTYFLAILFLGFSIGFATNIVLGGAWLSCLLTLPYVVPVLTYIRLWGNQPFLTVIASLLVSLALFYRMGRRSVWISTAQAALIYGLQVYAAVLMPSVFVEGAPVVGLFGLVALTMVNSRRELLHKIAGGLGLALALVPVIGFIVEWHALSKVSFFQHELHALPVTLRDMSFFLFPTEESGFLGGTVLIIAVATAVATVIYSPGRSRRVALGYLVFVSGLAGTASVVSLTVGEWWGPPLGYIDMVALPFHALFFAVFVRSVFRVSRGYVAGLVPTGTVPTRRVAELGLAALPWICLPVSLAMASTPTFHKHHPWPWPMAETPLVADLKREIGLSPGVPFRGRVVNLAGTQGPYPPSHPPFNNQHVYDYGFLYYVGNDHRNLGFWSYSIPTLTTTSNFTSPFFHLVMTRFLNEPSSLSLRGHVAATRFDRRILESLGTRFVIHDSPIPEGAVLRRTYGMAGRTLWLYELADPNLGTYSPTTVRVAATAEATLTMMTDQEMDFRQEAAAQAALSTPLVEAESSGLQVFRDTLRLEARSRDISLLVLPVEYSHCLIFELATPYPDQLKILRVNLNQTGVVFKQSVTGDIRLHFGVFANRGCRWRDLAEARRMRLGDTEGWWPATTPLTRPGARVNE